MFCFLASLVGCGGGGSTSGPAVVPVITSFTPQSGTSSGGTKVTINGSGLTGITSITFELDVGAHVNVISDSQATVTTPTHTSGTVDVRVTTPTGTVTASNTFKYVTAGIISTIAGTTGGISGDRSAAVAAKLQLPYGIAFDNASNLIIADYLNCRIRVVAKSSGTYYGIPMTVGNIYTAVGSACGLSGDGGTAVAAQLSVPTSVKMDRAGNLFIADGGNHRIRMIPNISGTYYGLPMTAGNIYTVAGTVWGLSGDGGPAIAAKLYWPQGMTLDDAGNLIIADANNARIRVVAATTGTYYGVPMITGYIYTIAGTTVGLSGDGGAAAAALLNIPVDVVLDAAGNVIVSDEGNHRIRVIAKVPGTYFGVPMLTGNIYTVAGSVPGLFGDGGPANGSQLNGPAGVTLDSVGNLIIADRDNNRVRAVANATGTYFGIPMTAGNIYTVAGTTAGLSGDGGAAVAAQLNWLMSVAVDSSGNLNIADSRNNLIRAVSP
jgi:sugar lactone lactonase YvrE